MNDFEHARTLLHAFKGDAYLYGFDVLPDAGQAAAALVAEAGPGRQAALVRGTFPDSDDHVRTIRQSLERAGVAVVAEIQGARPNAPREDVERIAEALRAAGADVIISLGGGSVIDATKAAEVLNTLGDGGLADIDDYFGTGEVTRGLTLRARAMSPHVAIQTVASSAAHLTKYSNITDLETGQKKLIVDEAIVPERPVFDYALTFSQPPALTADGAMDGLSHSLEVFYGAVGGRDYARIREV
ncbi:MAG TPA: iron-containing alcohol dehydrogenase, partial [Anaerolineae bacterium]|nr:iron-containing alcohol dehydrogenase [Anaerolineae bacterium]